MDPGWILAIVAVTTAVVSLVVWAVRGMWKTFRRTDEFLDDWNGRPPSPGHRHVPGVMERLESLEAGGEIARDAVRTVTERLDSQDHVLDLIRSEVTYDHGQSLKDTVRQILAQISQNP